MVMQAAKTVNLRSPGRSQNEIIFSFSLNSLLYTYLTRSSHAIV